MSSTRSRVGKPGPAFPMMGNEMCPTSRWPLPLITMDFCLLLRRSSHHNSGLHKRLPR